MPETARNGSYALCDQSGRAEQPTENPVVLSARMGERDGRDRDEIVELMGRYATLFDTKDFEHMPAQVFTDPLVWDFEKVTGAPGGSVPLAVLMNALRPVFVGFEATFHSIVNHQVDIDGDRARIRAHIRSEHWLRRDLVESGSNCWLAVGFYEDEAVRTPDGWRLSLVRPTVTYRENDHLAGLARTEGMRILGRA